MQGPSICKGFRLNHEGLLQLPPPSPLPSPALPCVTDASRSFPPEAPDARGSLHEGPRCTKVCECINNNFSTHDGLEGHCSMEVQSAKTLEAPMVGEGRVSQNCAARRLSDQERLEDQEVLEVLEGLIPAPAPRS